MPQQADALLGVRSGLPDLTTVTTILCDADGNLFDSEVPAFEASVGVVNELLAALGSPERHGAEELRRTSSGRNFRSLAVDFSSELGRPIGAAELDRWVDRERSEVTAHLTGTLRPDETVTRSLDQLASRYRLAVVTSSALARVGPCLDVTGLAAFFAQPDRFSAADSLPTPTSKPDPAVYRTALRELGLSPEQALAIEDAEAGVLSATAAGIATIGNLAYVPGAERTQRRAALLEAGAVLVAEDWSELVAVLSPGDRR